MIPQHHLPADIERTSLSIITAELEALGLTPPPETAAVVKRVIHTTADFDYAKNLRFTPGAVAAGVAALWAGTPIITDTNMALSGISKPALARLGGSALCYMADPEVAAAAKNRDPSKITRYVMNTATLFHKFYNACRVQGEDEKLMQARISLCLATRVVLANLLKLLKITAPESM